MKLFTNVSHYFQVYKKFLSINASKSMSFRANFFLFFIIDSLFYFTNILSQNFIFNQTQHIGIWDRNHFLFFTSFLLLMDWFHTFFIGHSFWMLSRNIRQGDMDFIMLRPLHPIFSTFFSQIRFDCFLNFFLALAIFIYFGMQVDLSLWQWMATPFLIIVSCVLWFSIEMVMATFMFWAEETTGINFMRMQLQHISRWPDFIYRPVYRTIFIFVVPILLIFNGPVHLLYGDQSWYLGPFLLLMAALWVFILIKFWNYSMRRYESASS